MPVNFDLNDLYAFRALVEYGNFRRAAESICLSQSALSRRIEKLESALGIKLFDRTTRRVTPDALWANLCRAFGSAAGKR
ncbi:Morphology and auto-aggregation control protein [Raoultella terrigena]|uniref:Morphology and auto-aggregation control protein n=1 Tax=Raoultella terrigena TaxID=577 RepID=A0A4U9CV52_RAOTE|nr:Morphology and auto-aggregation control protein [Raoultella terrigena]